MYRGTPSPIFDVPEIPTLRRVKPLPKRRRTTLAADLVHHEETLSLSSPALVAQSAQALLQQSAAAALLHQHQQQPLDVLGPNATAEELLAHADTLSARMALQSYYMPILGGVQSFLAGAAAISNGGGTGDRNNTNANNNNNNNIANNSGNTAMAAAAAALAAVAGAGAGRNGQLHFPMPPGPLSDLDSLEFGVHFAAAAAAAAAAGVAMGGLGGLGMSLGINGMNMGMPMGGGGGGGGGAGGGGRDDDGRGDPDYVDHLPQHGNTKKRKVPANAGGSPRGGHGGDGGRSGSSSSLFPDDESNGGGPKGSSTLSADFHRDRERDRDRDQDRDRDRDRDDYDSSTPPLMYPPPPFPGQLSIVIQKRGKLTAATLAGLQHKEMLKSRKRQLAAVMGALSHGDTLALDQALSASYPLIGGVTGSMGGGGGGGGGEALRVHKSKRESIRLARAMKLTRVPRHPDAAAFPTSDFGFVCPSATADRLIATKEEVAMLRRQFEVELERQAAKAAKMAVIAGGGGGGKLMKAGGGRGKREKAEREKERAHQKVSERAQQRARISGGGNNGDQTAEFLDPASVGIGVMSAGGGSDGTGGENGGIGGGKAKSGKKKKRSALANASNPHHLRNYVPSRLPHTGGGDGPGGQGPNVGNANTIWPLPLRFLSAEIPPRRRKKPAAVPLIQLRHPTEEWICAFCEYDLFYGDDAGYRRAVKSRKKILKRRRRARERAAAAASGSGGTSTAKAPPAPPPSEELDEYETGDTGLDELGSAPPKNKWKDDPQQAFG